MAYYPDSSVVIGSTRIIREYKLPDRAAGRQVINEGIEVNADSLVLEGTIPSDVIMIDAVKQLGLRSADQITESMLHMPVGEIVDPGTIIMQTDNSRRAKRVVSPVRARVAYIDAGQVVLQADPQEMQVYANTTGRVLVATANRVTIEVIGTQIQCAWGNNLVTYGQLAEEPPEGLIAVGESDLPIGQVSDMVVILAHSIQSHEVFPAGVNQGVRGLIAPSMASTLRDWALAQTYPVLLTEGFGDVPYSEIVYNLLRGNVGRQATIDASEPSPWRSDRPEVVIALSLAGSGRKSSAPERNMPLNIGLTVRATRLPYLGRTGRVVSLPSAPMTVESGLRLPVAEIEFSGDEVAFVPLANLELLGRPADAQGRA